MEQSTIDLAAAKKLIDAVDLKQTIARLIKVHHWKPKEAEAAAIQYRNFLYLKKKYDGKYVLPPSYDMDEVWHAHILHTKDYCDFCDQVYGGYLHHHPHHGKDNSITDEELEAMFEAQTQRLYFQEFGQYIEAVRSLPLKVIIKRLISFVKKPKDFTTPDTELGKI
jgi:hypothetical protein